MLRKLMQIVTSFFSRASSNFLVYILEFNFFSFSLYEAGHKSNLYFGSFTRTLLQVLANTMCASVFNAALAKMTSYSKDITTNQAGTSPSEAFITARIRYLWMLLLLRITYLACPPFCPQHIKKAFVEVRLEIKACTPVPFQTSRQTSTLCLLSLIKEKLFDSSANLRINQRATSVHVFLSTFV